MATNEHTGDNVDGMLNEVEAFLLDTKNREPPVDKSDLSDLLGAFDQLASAYACFANCVAAYRGRLEERGVPQDEAAVLTRDVNWIWLCKQSFPQQTPEPPSY